MSKEKNYFGINPNTYKLLFSDNESLSKEELSSEENTMILHTLNVFTKLNHENIFVSLLKKHFSHRLNIELEKIRYNQETKQYEYVLDDKIITFDMISNTIKDKAYKKELMSNKRFGKCHERPVQLAHNIQNSQIVTGVVTTDTGKYLHTVIEVKKGDKIYILDWTRNLILKKEDYIKLFDFFELSSFDSIDVFYDKELMTKMNMLDIGMKPYLSFRNEFIKDLEKNIHLLSEEEQEELKQAKR